MILSLLRRLLGVTLKVDHDDWFVSDNPPIVPWRNQRSIASLEVSLRAIIHDHMQCSRYLVLEMWSFTALRLCDRLHVSGPPPPRLEHGSCDRRFADLHKLKFSLLKGSCLVGGIRALNFQFAQCSSNHMWEGLAAGRDCLFTKLQNGLIREGKRVVIACLMFRGVKSRSGAVLCVGRPVRASQFEPPSLAILGTSSCPHTATKHTRNRSFRRSLRCARSCSDFL